jgi:hypothetical protein
LGLFNQGGLGSSEPWSSELGIKVWELDGQSVLQTMPHLIYCSSLVFAQFKLRFFVEVA